MTHTITLKELRPGLPKVVEAIDSRMERYIVTKRGKPAMMMMSIDDYESIMETIEIMSDAKAVKRIRQAREEARQGLVVSLDEVKKKLGKF